MLDGPSTQSWRGFELSSGFCGHFQPAAQGQPARFSAGPQSGQPSSADATGVACFGEIHNAADLCRQLDLAGDTPLPRVLLAGWQCWSVNLLPRLDGVFALALRDGDELLLYRDPSGLQNIYFHTGRGGQVSFATNLQNLLGLPGVEHRLARRSLHEYLRFGDIAAPNTMFEDVAAVEAGQLVRCSARGIETSTVSIADSGNAAPTSFSEAMEMLDAHLQRSVQTRLADAERPAAFLSGGVDSAVLCAMAARHRKDLTAITVGFDAVPYDETPVAQRIALHLGLAHQVLRFDRQQVLSGFERLCQGAEQPFADPAAAATVLAFDHCRSRFDVVIDGTGADEAVGMMPPRHVRLAVAYATRLPQGVRQPLDRLASAVPGLAGYAPVLNFEHPAETMIRWNGFTRPEIEALCGEPVSFAHTHFYRTFHRYPRGAHFQRYSALVNGMPSDRLSQAVLISGLPVRYPFCGAETDRFIRQLRTDYRYLPGQPKRILRALLARYVPTQIWDAPKHGFNFPLHEFLAAEDYLLVRRYLDAERWQTAGLLSPDKVQHYARQFMAGDQRLTFRVWALVVLGAWLDKHDERRKT